MSSSELQSDVTVDPETEKTPLKLDIKVDSPQSCLRHVVVTIPQEEIARYMRKAYDELIPDAQVPGFRAGRAPRKLVEKQFRDRVTDQVKSSLLMDSLTQVTESAEFSAISEPDFNYESIDLPVDGDFKYEFSVEVRPEFETPNWKGLSLVRPTETIDESEVERAVNGLIGRSIQPEAVDDPAVDGDLVLLTAKFFSEGRLISEMEEERVRVTSRLSFSDGICENFGEIIAGAKEGETRKGIVKVGDEAPNEELRGKDLDAEFYVIEVSRKQLPELTPSYLEELGDFASKEEFYDFVRNSLERQVVYRQEQALRKQIVETLTGDANWELPPALVKRQTRRELERKILELRRSSFDEDTIRRLVNVMRQNAQSATEASLREHFILEQIAEDVKIDADAEDYEAELELIAEQSDMPVRRVRARLEKSGQMDALRNQIVERKVITMITEAATVTDEASKVEGNVNNEFAVYHSVLGSKDTDSIPEAKYDDKGPKEDDNKAAKP